MIKEKSEEEAFFWILDQIGNGSYDLSQVVYNVAKMWGISPMTALREPLFALSRMWLQGTKLGKREMNAIGVTRNIAEDLNAVSALGGIVRLLTCEKAIEAGSPASPVVWVLDDSHVLFANSSKEQQMIQRGIRATVDECPLNLLVIMSFATSDPEKIQMGLIPDLKTVTAHTIIQVPPLTKKESFLFIADLTGHRNFRKEESTERFYPYTEESIEKAIAAMTSKGVDLLPRSLIKCFEHLTDEAQKAQLIQIDSGFVEKFFDESCPSKFCPLLAVI